MRTIYPKVIIVLIILMVALVMNFRFDPEPVSQPAPVVKKVVVIKKVYIRVPTPADTSRTDTTTIITLPKEPLTTPVPDVRKFRRSRNLHKTGFIS
jgi:hypothetical protein